LEKIKIVVQVVFSGAIIYFATSIILLTLELSKLRETVPEIMSSIEKLESDAKINSILETANLGIKEIPNILKEIKKVRELTPSILKQVDNTNKNIPVILKEVKQVREVIPSVLEEVKQTRKSISPILEESKAIRKTIPPILKESQNIRKSIPPILDESKAIRKDIPIRLDKVEKITKNIEKISNDVASGAVSGTVRGIINLPKDLVEKTADTLRWEEESE